MNKIKIIISDIDGVWTDGSVYKGTDNMEFKKFSVFDGVGVAYARAADLKIAIISARYSPATEYRAKELNIEDCYNGGLNKLHAYNEIKQKYSNSNIGVIGTKATITSDIYKQKIKESCKNVNVKSLATILGSDLLRTAFIRASSSLKLNGFVM